MKRADLKVGGSYYYDQSSRWMEHEWGNRAVLVNDKRYRINQRSRGWPEESYTEDPEGKAVLVDIFGRFGEAEAERTAVPPAHLRGEWETVSAQTQRAAKERREREQAKEDEQRAAHRRARELNARALELDVNSKIDYGYGAPTHIKLSLDDFQRLLALATAD